MKKHLKKELLALRVLIPSILFLTVFSIISKFIKGYNSAVSERFSELEKIANNSPAFVFSDCSSFYNHPFIFTLFAIFIFLTFLFYKKLTQTNLFTITSGIIFVLTLLQSSYLSLWFAKIVNIEWNYLLIGFDIFDLILYFLFTLTIFLQIKIIYYFVRERFQAKISLK